METEVEYQNLKTLLKDSLKGDHNFSNALIELVQDHVQDMVVYATEGVGNCELFELIGGNSTTDMAILRDLKPSGTHDLTINKCGDLRQLSTSFSSPKVYQIDRQSRGFDNPCLGVMFDDETLLHDSQKWRGLKPTTVENGSQHLSLSENCNILQSVKKTPNFWELALRLRNKAYYGDPFRYFRSYRKHFKPVTYMSHVGSLDENCSTAPEILKLLTAVLPENETTLLNHIVSDLTRFKPASAINSTDFLHWNVSYSRSSSDVKGALGVAIGSVFGGLFGWLFGTVSCAASGLSGLASNLGNLATSAALSGLPFKISQSGPDFDKSFDWSSESSESSEERVIQNETSEQKKEEEKKQGAPDTNCFFKDLRQLPPGVRLSSCGERAELVPLSEILLENLQRCSHCRGAENEVDLIFSRLGIFHDDWTSATATSAHTYKKYICRKHLAEYGTAWHKQANKLKMIRAGSQNVPACMFPTITGFTDHARPVRAHHTYRVSKHQSELVFKLKETLIPIGTPICQSHQTQLTDFVSEQMIERKGYCLKPKPPTSFAESPILNKSPLIKAGCADATTSVCEDDDYRATSGQTSGDALQVQKAVRELGKAGHITGVNFPVNAYSELAKATQKRRVATVRKLQELICNAMGKESAASVCSQAAIPLVKDVWDGYGNQKLDCVLQNVRIAFFNAVSSKERKHILSLVSPVVPFSVLQDYIPGVTRHLFSQSRRDFAMYQGQSPPKPEINRIRYDERKVTYFIDYISQPHMYINLPFGSQTTRYSSGEKTDIPSIVRIQRQGRIVDEYLSFLHQTEKFTTYGMSKSSLLRILKYLPAPNRKSVQGLDYFTYSGLEAIDELLEVVMGGSAFHQDSQQEVAMKLKQAKQYLRGDFKVNVQVESTVPDHCMSHALADGRNPLLNKVCTHAHDAACSRCEQVKDVLGDIQRAVSRARFSDDNEKAKVLYKTTDAIESILEWKRHQLRTVYLDREKQKVVEDLSQDTVFITLDWAMKFLPTRGREEQTSWFGKRGISWHISVAIIRVRDPATATSWASVKSGYFSRTFVHVFDEQTKQDSTAVTGIILHMLKEIKQEAPFITKCIIRSDNAGCYHGSQTIASMHKVSELSGIKVIKWTFSEPQSGKGPADRMSAIIKRHVRFFVDEGKSCTNAQEFLYAVKSYKGVKSVSAYRCNIEDNKIEHGSKGNAAIPGINSFYDFSFSWNPLSQIKAHGFPGIGHGITIPHEYWFDKQKYAVLDVLASAHQDLSTKPEATVLWQHFLKDEKTEVSQEDNSVATTEAVVTNRAQHVFECPVEACTMHFMKFGNVLRHIMLGNHKYVRERETLRDVSIEAYKEAMKKSEYFSAFSDIHIAIDSVEDQTVRTPALGQGWALKTSQTGRKRFDQEQLSFLKEKFTEGVSGKKADPRKVASEMMNAKTTSGHPRFRPEQYLRWTQISSFFSRLANEHRSKYI